MEADKVVWTFMADRQQLIRIQEVVVLHDLRFHNSISASMTDGRFLVQVSSHRASSEQWNAAQRAIEGILTPVVGTTTTSAWQRMWAWLRWW